MANTTNFGWETPDDTDLVKDGALAMRTLGNAIDTSLVDLKGGTTNQILAKNSNTDMDFKWVANDVGDITAVTAGTGLSGGGTSGDVTLTNTVATTFDAKGDLVVGTGADTFAKLVAGSNGDTLVADSSTTTGLRWSADWNTGKNKIINGDFNINQRAFASTTSNGTFGFDRWYYENSGGTVTSSPQTFTPGAAPVAGYESTNFSRVVTASQSAAGHYAMVFQKIEDVRTLAGQTATVSFWAKSGSGTPNIAPEFQQNFGSGGSSAVFTSVTQQTISTTWTRYSATVSIPSISGKTLGAGSNLQLIFWLSAGTNFNSRTGSLGVQNNTFDIWGVQVEAGSVATPFTTATGTLAGEFQACQRYYQRYSQTGTTTQLIGNANAVNTTIVDFPFPTQVAFRSAPGSLETVNVGVYQFSNATTYTSGTWTIASAASANNIPVVRYTHGSAVFTANNTCALVTNSGASVGYIGLSAEL